MVDEQYTSGATKARDIFFGGEGGILFNGGIAQNAIDARTFVGILPANRDRITEIVIHAMERIEYDIYFFTSAAFNTADPKTDKFLDNLNLNLVTAGRQIAGAGLWRMGARLVEPIAYVDESNTYSLHIGIIPRTAPKSAGLAGEVVLKIIGTPTFG